MEQYKIYREDNYITIVKNSSQEYFYGHTKEVFVDKSNINRPSYRIFNVKDYDGSIALDIDQILKQDGLAYTISEWETFYKENTGGSGGGDASAANQVIANTKLTSIDTKVSTEATQLLVKAKTDNLDVALSTRLKPADTLAKVSVLDTITNPLPSGTNLLGKLGIDQTTNGTTNRVNIGTDGQVATNGVIFTFSTVNSTTTQLAASATFTGAIESIVNQPAYSILAFSDQPGTLTVKQYTDAAGTKLNQTIAYSLSAGVGFARSGSANGNYFQVTFQNTGGSTTTTLQIDTAFGTIAPATQLNNNPVGINEVNGLPFNLGANSGASSLPVLNSVETISGNITTQNLVPNGIATANSSVDLLLNGNSLLAIQVTGTYTGALSLQITNDGSRWETVTSASLQNALTGVNSATIPSASVALYQTGVAGFLRARISGLAAMTGTATVTLRAVSNTSLVSLEQAIPTGTNSIGNIGTVATVTTVSTLSNTTQITPGVAATNLGKAEDAVHVSGDTGVAILALRNDTLTSNASASGDYILPTTDLYGSQIIKDQQRHKRSYSCSFVVTPAATPTDVFQLIGSATTTVSIQKIVISGTMTTGGMTDVYISKRSTANTLGTSTSATMVRHQTSDAVATAVGSIYTANPTLGTPIGNVRILSIPFATTTDKTNNNVEINFGERAKGLILAGVAETMAINLNGATVTGLSLKVSVEFTEE